MRLRIILTFLVLSQVAFAANRVPIGKLLEKMIHRSTLVEPGSKPFYLKATISDSKDGKSEFNGTVEEYWVSPTKWRRVIKLRDFSQTRIVNGDSIFEDNSGDYFPLNDETLINEIIDPLPQSAVDLMNKLDMTAAEPGSGQGQCMSEKYFNDSEGTEKRVLLAYDCNNGLLIYIWSPTCCYGVMTDYRKFHGKMIAFATKDNPINIHVDTLTDVATPAESLFAVPQPTPPAKRMTTILMTESKLRNLAAEKTEIEWPSIAKKPEGVDVNVQVVVGRDGRVKEASTYSSDQAIKDAALTAARKWRFNPQDVDGVPAQVSSNLKFLFPASYKTAGGPAIAPIFDHMRNVSGIRLDGSPAFHLKASFTSQDGAVKGNYEETWLSPKKWRREVTLNNTSLVEVRTEDAFYRTFPGSYSPRVADDVIDAVSFGLPGDNDTDLHESDWAAENTKLMNLPVLRLSKGYINPKGNPDAMTTLYFVQEEQGFLRGRYHYSMVTIFNDLQVFAGKNIARKLTLIGGDVKKVDIIVDTLEPVTNVSENIFQLSKAKPVFTSKDEENPRFTQANLVYSVKPSMPGWHGNVICDLEIDEHGHVRDVEVKGVTDESVITPIRAALMYWEYEPARWNGHPTLGFAHVRVQ